jgi:hypothetical protein
MVQNVDLRSTFDEIARATPPAYVDGTSFLGEARGTSSFPRSYAYAEGLGIDGLFMKSWRAVYTPDEAYHQWTTGAEEFYNLTSDPYELDAVRMDQGESSSDGEKLRSVLEEFRNCAGSECIIK